MRIELTTETLQVFLAKALVHASPNFPTLRLLVSRFIGFLFLKNLMVLPVKNIQHYWEEMCLFLYPMKSHSRRRLSAESFFKSWFEDSEYLLLIVDTFGPQTQDSWMQIRCDRHLHQWPSNKPSVLTTVLDFIDGWFPITCYECTIEQGPSQYTLGHFNFIG